MNMYKEVMRIPWIVGLLSVLVMGCASGAAAAGGEVRLEPVTVTAEKRSEDIQDIPSSISVLTEDRNRGSGHYPPGGFNRPRAEHGHPCLGHSGANQPVCARSRGGGQQPGNSHVC